MLPQDPVRLGEDTACCQVTRSLDHNLRARPRAPAPWEDVWAGMCKACVCRQRSLRTALGDPALSFHLPGRPATPAGRLQGCQQVGLEERRPASLQTLRPAALRGCGCSSMPWTRGATINPGGDTGWRTGPGSWSEGGVSFRSTPLSGSPPTPWLLCLESPIPPGPATPGSQPAPAPMGAPLSFLQPSCGHHQATVSSLSLMFWTFPVSCPPLTARTRASVQSLLHSHKQLMRKWKPREGKRLNEVTQRKGGRSKATPAWLQGQQTLRGWLRALPQQEFGALAQLYSAGRSPIPPPWHYEVCWPVVTSPTHSSLTGTAVRPWGSHLCG